MNKCEEFEKDSMILYNEDCMNIMADIPSKSIDWAIVDPEQGKKMSRKKDRGGSILQPNGERSTILGGDYIDSDWDEKPAPIEYFEELFRISKEQIIWGIQYFPYLNVGPGRIIWDKMNGDSHQYDCEIAYCSAIDRTEIIRYMWNGMHQGEQISRDPVIANKQQGNKKLNEKRIHECQKPVKLYSWQYNRFCNPSDSIIDTHLGSGSNWIANERFQGVNPKGKFIACEKHPQIFNRSIERIDKETAQMSLF